MFTLDNILSYIEVFGLSTFKFFLGPFTGIYHADLSVFETAILTTLGMMTTVIFITYFGEKIRTYYFKKRGKKASVKMTPRKRKVIKVWHTYGMKGIAFLTPLILTPIGGTIIAVSFGAKKRKIILSMLVSAMIWSVIISLGLYFLGDVAHKYIF